MSKSFPWSCLGDDGVAFIVAGQSPSSENYNMHGDGLPFYQGKSDFGHIYPVPRVWCTHPHKIAKRGDVLISVRAPVGDLNIANEDCAIGRGLAAIRAKNETDAPFLFFSLKHIKQKLMDSSTGSTFASINQSTLQNVDIPFPDKNLRFKIGKLLQYVYNRIEYESNLYSKTQIFKHATMHKLFTCGLRGEPQKETEIGLVPESWRILPLDGVAFVQTGVAKGRKLKSEDLIEVPYLRVANVQDGRLDLSEIKTIRIRSTELDRYLLQEGDVLLTEGGDFDKLGRGFIWREEIADCIHQNHVFAVRVDRDELLPEFFAYLAQSPYGKTYFLKVAHKTTNLACINTTKLKAFPVAFPGPDEQQEIVDILDAIDQKINLHRCKKVVLEELFKSLLHKLMTGEVRVDELDLSALAPQDKKEPDHVQ